MRQLWYKEYRTQKPFLVLMLVVSFLSVFLDWMAEAPDQRPLVTECLSWGGEDAASFFIVLFFFTFTLASGLLVREHNEGTIEFLDALPVRRRQAALVKIVLALGILILFPLAEILSYLGMHAVSRTSLDRDLHLQYFASILAVHGVFIVSCLGVGLLLSFLRRLAWLMLALLIWTYVALEPHWHTVALLNPLMLWEPPFRGNQVLLPWPAILTQLGVGLGCGGLAVMFFLRGADGAHSFFSRLGRRRSGVFLLWLLGAAIAVSWLFILAGWFSGFEESEPEKVKVEEVWKKSTSQTGQIVGKHYIFTFTTYQEEPAVDLAAKADSIYGVVRDFLGAEDLPRPIPVVLSRNLKSNAVGWAIEGAIEIDPIVAIHLDKAAAVLGHETVHIILEYLADGRLKESFNTTRFLHEGVASYVEHRFFQPQWRRDNQRLVAAIQHDRRELDFDELIDTGALRRRLDVNLVYAAGEIFCEAMVQHNGDESIGRLVRGFAGLDHKLEGEALLRAAFQTAGYSLDAVLADYVILLDELADQHSAEAEILQPMLTYPVWNEDWVAIKGRWHEPPDDWWIVCRIRMGLDESDADHEELGRDEDGKFVANRQDMVHSRFWYQVGYRREGETIWEPWYEVVMQD